MPRIFPNPRSNKHNKQVDSISNLSLGKRGQESALPIALVPLR